MNEYVLKKGGLINYLIFFLKIWILLLKKNEVYLINNDETPIRQKCNTHQSYKKLNTAIQKEN